MWIGEDRPIAETSPVGPRRALIVRRGVASRRVGRLFRSLTAGVAFGLLGLIAAIVLVLTQEAWPAIRLYGLPLLYGQVWDPGRGLYGAVPFVVGTLLTSGLALLMAVPVALGVAIFLSELAPPSVREPLSYLVELLAAVPSVVYGFWALAVISPLLQHQVEPTLAALTGGAFPFSGHSFGLDVFTASVVLAIMVLPTISAIARESLQAVPKVQREAALSLGATRWEATRLAVLGPARSGIVGGILLGLGRAVGETIAVALTIGNINQIPNSLFAPGQTIASLIANDFNAVSPPETNAIVEIGLVLLLVTLVINVIARLLIWRIRRDVPVSNRPRHSAGARLRALAIHRPVAGPAPPSRLTVTGGPIARPKPEPPAWRTAARFFAAARRRRRRAVHWTAVALMIVATTVAVAPLVSILWTAADRGGAAVVQPSFYTSQPTPACNPGPNTSCSLGGIGPYIVGTLVLLGLAGAIAIPVGILAGIYLSEYGRNRYGRTVSFFTDVMTGLPSILLGVFVFVVFLQYDRDIAHSAISGGVALAVLMIPLVTRTTEEALKTVPMSLRECALALGFPKHRVTLRITLGCARNAIVTGTLLATARAGGETAALLMTATGFEYWPHSLGQRIGALPLLIFQNGQFQYANWQEAAWGATLVLLMIMLVISLVARLTFRRTAAALESV